MFWKPVGKWQHCSCAKLPAIISQYVPPYRSPVRQLQLYITARNICRRGSSSRSSCLVPIIDDKKYGPCGSYSRLENHTHSSKWCLLWHKAILASEIKQTWIPTPESMSLVSKINQWSIPLLNIRRAKSMYKAWEYTYILQERQITGRCCLKPLIKINLKINGIWPLTMTFI